EIYRGISGMGWRSRRASKQALACLAVFGVGAIAGLLAGFGADPIETSELSPAEIVALRFAGDSAPVADGRDEAAPAAEPAGYALASAEDVGVSSLIFNPFPIYPTSAQATSAQATSAQATSASVTQAGADHVSATRPVTPPADSSLPPQLASVEPRIPAEALAYAAADALERPAPAARPDGANGAPTPVKKIGPPHPASASNAVLNSAQIASIKERLKLTSYQSTLWPPVESALRDISWQGHADPSRKTVSTPHGTIDPNSVPVQRLKSAAFPLIMSLNEDQKQEVRSMVRLMGLENLASQF
ncbi:MAG TPA: hypothetical protein VIY51_09835, partial [Xanthobacteraceae bacterium]